MRLGVRFTMGIHFLNNGTGKESSRSPHGVLDQSLRDCKGTPGGVPSLWRVYRDSLRTPWGLLGDSLDPGTILGLIPRESLRSPQRLLRDSSGTPQGLLGLLGDFLGLIGDSLGTPQQRVAQCNDLPPEHSTLRQAPLQGTPLYSPLPRYFL